MCVIIQNLVFGGGEKEPTRGEGRTMWRLGKAWGAAGIPPGATAHLVLALTMLSPAESQRLSLLDSAFNSHKKNDGHPQKHQVSPDHVDSDVTAMGKKRVPLTDIPGNNDSLLLYSKGKWVWEVLGRVINIKSAALSGTSTTSRCFCPHPGDLTAGRKKFVLKQQINSWFVHLSSIY